MRVSPGERQQQGHRSELRKAELGSGRQGEEGEVGQSLGEGPRSAGKPTGGNWLQAALVSWEL